MHHRRHILALPMLLLLTAAAPAASDYPAATTAAALELASARWSRFLADNDAALTAALDDARLHPAGAPLAPTESIRENESSLAVWEEVDGTRVLRVSYSRSVARTTSRTEPRRRCDDPPRCRAPVTRHGYGVELSLTLDVATDGTITIVSAQPPTAMTPAALLAAGYITTPAASTLSPAAPAPTSPSSP